MDYVLYHHGIKGMKWGVRRYQNKDGSLTPAGKKRLAKEEYKKARASAVETYRTATKRADSQYERDMAPKNAALDKVKKTYDDKDEATEKYYKTEIKKHQSDADTAKGEMEFWNDPDSFLYKEAASRYIDSTKSVRDLEVRRDAVVMANKIARGNATIKVHELYSDSSEKAANTKAAAYAKAGKEYADSIMSAKRTYKDAKKEAKKAKKK